MANQPKKYKKFVATAATATLVASAIVPVASASFSDVADSNSHKAAIDALVEAGVINGYEDGTFKPNAALTRGHVVKMLGKWAESQGFNVPADYATKARFNDVNLNGPDQELVKYAALLNDNGIFLGNNGALDAGSNITRENMALVLDRAVKAITGTSLVDAAATIPDVTVADLATAKAEARPAIQALRDLGVSNVANFDPKANVSRGQFASFLYRTAQLNAELTVKAIEVVDATTLKVTLSNGSVHTVTLEKALEPNVETEVKFTIDGKEYTAKVTYKVDAAVVTSLQVVNAVTVQVKFSVPVSATDAKLAGKVAIAGVTFDSAKTSLSSDGLTLTLVSANNAPINVTNAAAVVEEIATKADTTKKTAKYVTLVTYKDTVAPLISSVEAVTNGKPATSVTVKFSEPVAFYGVVRINGTAYSASPTSGDTVTITGLSLDPTKTHTLEIFNIQDYAGNNTVVDTKTFTVTIDTVAPTATVSPVSDNAIVVKFSKAMDEAKVKAALANGFLKDEALNTVTTDAAIIVSADKKEYTVNINAGNLFATRDTRTFTAVLAGTIEDSLGNKLVAVNAPVTLTKDVVKPVATGYNVVKNADGDVTGLTFTFSEELAAKGSVAFASVATVVNSNGQLSTLLNGLTSEPIEKGDTEISFKFGTPQEITGVLAVSLGANLVYDLAREANGNAAFSYNVDFGSATAATEFEVTNATSTGDVITVTFPEAVKGGAVAGSATDRNNYTLDGKPLPDGTSLIIDSTQKVVTITLQPGGIDADNAVAVLRVTGVQNTTNTKTVKPYAKTVAVQDTVAPVLESAIVIDGSTIELTFNENIAITSGDAAAIAASFAVVGNSATNYTVTGVAGVAQFPKKVRITIGGGLNLAETFTVETKANGVVTDASARKNVQKAAVKVTVSPKQ